MNSEEDGKWHRISNDSKFPSLSTALEEVRRDYDTEQDRKSNIEVRIGAIVGIDALLISVVGVFGQMHPLTKTAILVPALLAAGYGLAAFNSREYRKPGPEIDEIFAYARMGEANAAKNFIQNYRQAIKHNNEKNNERMDTLDTCFLLTAISFLLILISPFLNSAINAVLGVLGL